MSLEIAELLFDFGLVVLIWLIQLIVYPSFSYYQKNDLVQWHKNYTLRIGYVVMPLMIGQLSIAMVQLVRGFTILGAINLGLILMVWLSTFIHFVPLHNKIAYNILNDEILHKLIIRNWLRTLLWTVIFGIDLMGYLINISLV